MLTVDLCTDCTFSFCLHVDPPGKPEVTDVTRSSVTIAWGIPFNDGGSKIVGYIVERKPWSDDEWDNARWLKCNYTTITETHFTVGGLGEAEIFEFRVIAKNGAGVHSAPSETTGPITCKDEYSKILLLDTVCYVTIKFMHMYIYIHIFIY